MTRSWSGRPRPAPAGASPSSSSIIKICKARWAILCLLLLVLGSTGWGQQEIVTEIVAPDWPSFVRKSALRADSFLARLSDTEFDQGMAAFRAHGANIDPAEAVIEEIDWFVFTKRA